MDERRAPQRLWGLPSWLAARTAAEADRLVRERLEAGDLRKHHFTVLVALDENGPASQAQLGRRLGLDRSDLHAVVDRLHRDGLVSRERDAADRRRNVVALTAAGRRVLRRLERDVDAAQEELLAPLSGDERAHLVALLTRVVKHHAGGRAAPTAAARPAR